MYEYRIQRDVYASGREMFTVLCKLKDHEKGWWLPFRDTYTSRAFALNMIQVHKGGCEDRRLEKTTYEDIP